MTTRTESCSMWCQEILLTLWSEPMCDVCVRAVRLVRRRCQTCFAVALGRRGNVMGKRLRRSWIAKLQWGWAGGAPGLSLRRVGRRERLSSAVIRHFVHPLSDKGPRDLWDLCPRGTRFVPSLLSSLPLGYEVPARGLAKNTVQSVQSPESSATNLSRMINNSTSQKNNKSAFMYCLTFAKRFPSMN